MGYYTHYSLVIEPVSPSLIGAIQEEELKEDPHSEFAHAFDYKGVTEDSHKWYRWEEDMRRISLRYPHHLFHLHGEGEENDDIWTATFKGGLVHYRTAQIVIAPFDERELK